METPENQYQRRAIVAQRHFILADNQQPDRWALPGPVVLTTDSDGHRHYGSAKTITTEDLQAWAQQLGLAFTIVEKYPVIRRGITENLSSI